MENCFENNTNEINQIITKVQKDKSTAIFKVARNKICTIEKVNNTVSEAFIDHHHQVSMHLYSSQGYYITGSSDKMYLPDVISRLYQSLDNLLKANKGHKVKKNIIAPELFSEVINDIQYTDISEWDIPYYTSLLTKIYESIPAELCDDITCKIGIKGFYSLCMAANSNQGIREFDEFAVELYCELTTKNSMHRRLSINHILTAEDIRSKNIEFPELEKKLQLYAVILSNPVSKYQKQADYILFDTQLTHALTYQIVHADHKNDFIKDYSVENRNLLSLGMDDSSEKEQEVSLITEDSLVKIAYPEKVFKLGTVNILDFVSVIDNQIKLDSKGLGKAIPQFKKNSVLVVFGNAADNFKNPHGMLRFGVTLGLYIDKDLLTWVDMNTIELDKVTHMQLMGNKINLHYMNEWNRPITIRSYEYSLIKLDERSVLV